MVNPKNNPLVLKGDHRIKYKNNYVVLVLKDTVLKDNPSSPPAIQKIRIRLSKYKSQVTFIASKALRGLCGLIDLLISSWSGSQLAMTSAMLAQCKRKKKRKTLQVSRCKTLDKDLGPIIQESYKLNQWWHHREFLFIANAHVKKKFSH